MRTILLPFSADEPSWAAQGIACDLAKRFGSHVEGLFVEETPQIIGGEGMTLPPEYLAQLDQERRARGQAARAEFEKALAERGIPIKELDPEDTGVSAGWRELEGQESAVVGEYGRLFDLIVVGRSRKLSAGGWEPTCEAALFESGRPVIIAAEAPVDKLGEMVVIAWNGSTETALAIALAMPILARAERVVVLSVEDAMVSGPSGEQVATHLRRNGVPASPLAVQSLGRLAGEAILEETATIGADLLIKGAYTHSRVRQMIFGGATRHILSSAKLPVLMAR